jgi:hypothetical protein
VGELDLVTFLFFYYDAIYMRVVRGSDCCGKVRTSAYRYCIIGNGTARRAGLRLEERSDASYHLVLGL